MQTYEIYQINGFCDAEWERLGEVQASSVADIFPQVAERWPDYSSSLLVACGKDEVISLATIKKVENCSALPQPSR